jgi:hypothetical protein
MTRTDLRNAPMRRILEKLGWEFEGVLHSRELFSSSHSREQWDRFGAEPAASGVFYELNADLAYSRRDRAQRGPGVE